MHIADSTEGGVLLHVRVYSPAEQGTGSFDGGRITEIKPIGFAGEGSMVNRVGPLFYWAWASAAGPGKIGLHPHQGFEIVSYVLTGQIGHKDTLGTESRIGAGGAQVMQTGSGVSHEEEMFGDETDFFQIWFEPSLPEAVLRPPTYRDFRSEDLPVERVNGVSTKAVIGANAPMQLVTDANLLDITVAPGSTYEKQIPGGRAWAAVTVSGSAHWSTEEGEEHAALTRYFAVLEALRDSTVQLRAAGQESVRVIIVDVPIDVDYPLYPK